MGVTIALPAYGEEENLKVLLPKIKENAEKLGEPYEIIVVDAAEPLDDTETVCKVCGVKYVRRVGNSFGDALATIPTAASMDKILVMDADGSHDPVYIPDIYRKFLEEQADVCIGSRYVEGGVTDDSPKSVFMSKILNTTFRLALGFKAKDISGNFRMYDAAQLRAIKITKPNYDVLQEILFRLYRNNPKLKVVETPIEFKKRRSGESKRKLLPFIMNYGRTLGEFTYERFRNFILYGVIGVAGMAVDWSTAMAAFKATSMGEEAASLCGNVAGFLFNFVLNTFLNFKKSDKLFARFISYAIICVGGMAVSTGLIALLKTKFAFGPLKLGVLIFIALVQYVLNKKITYK